MLYGSPSVIAQMTTIANVTYTKSALFDIDTQTPTPPIIVNATVAYGDAKAGYYLAVGVFDLDDGNLVGGLGSSSPQPCSSTTPYAGCIVLLTNEHGSERMQFSLEHPKAVWNLALVAALLDDARNTISNSYSDYTFTISVQTALTLTVIVPPTVPVDVDGVNGSGGSIQLALPAGNHNVSVPDFVSFGDQTRLKFVSWSDGSKAKSRLVDLDHDITLTGNYATEYYLEVISPVAVQGTGWYDAESMVTVSIHSASEPMSGIMGILGGKWVFQGWSVDENEVSRSPVLLITMDYPKVVNVLWTPDYTVPLILLSLATAFSVGVYFFKRMGFATRSVRKRRRSNPRARPKKQKMRG